MKDKLLIAVVISTLMFNSCNGDNKTTGLAKDKVCSLLTTVEASSFIGKPLNDGKKDKHNFPTVSACVWTSKKTNMPELALTYYIKAKNKQLDYYAPPSNMMHTIVLKVDNTANETIVVVNNKNENAIEFIARSGNNVVLIMPPYTKIPKNSAKWKEAVELINKIANKAK